MPAYGRYAEMNYSLLRRIATVLWTDERRTRIRLQSWSLGLAIYVACTIVMIPFAQWRVLSGPLLAKWLLFVLVSLGVFHVLIRTQWSSRLADPAMSQAQIVLGIVAVMMFYAFSGEVRGAALFPLMLILTFGAFSVSWRRMAALTLFALIVMGCTMIAMHALWPGRYSTVVDLANFVVGMVVLPGVSSVAVLLGSLRARLRRQRAELQAALARIQDLATLDDLTGLANRRRAQELLSSEIARGERTKLTFAVALIDLDHFKCLNDRFGHAGGDDALRHFADAARNSVRNVDMVARWGGEEFLILMPETDESECASVLNRLRQRVEALNIPFAQGEMRFTISAGVARHFPGQTVADTVARADRALYRAKASGRNRVESASEEEEVADFQSAGYADTLPCSHGPVARESRSAVSKRPLRNHSAVFKARRRSMRYAATRRWLSPRSCTTATRTRSTTGGTSWSARERR
jgi:diguanylate cyclase (GGDEF)-like protein